MTDKYQYNVMDMLLNGLVMSPDIEHKIQGPSGHVMSEKNQHHFIGLWQ